MSFVDTKGVEVIYGALAVKPESISADGVIDIRNGKIVMDSSGGALALTLPYQT